jgi:Tfp pilus assembly protein PilP
MGGNPAKRQQSSDALLEVGNFLGQRNGTLERINDRILKTNQEMVIQQKITNTKLDNLKPSADTIGVPLS